MTDREFKVARAVEGLWECPPDGDFSPNDAFRALSSLALVALEALPERYDFLVDWTGRTSAYLERRIGKVTVPSFDWSEP